MPNQDDNAKSVPEPKSEEGVTNPVNESDDLPF